MTTILNDPRIEQVVSRLLGQSEAQEEAIGQYFQRRAAAGELSWDGLDEQSHRFMADKLVAFQREKAEFCYLLCRALGARRVVEAGTSYGV